MIMYGIFTKTGALVAKVKAVDIHRAEDKMHEIIHNHPHLNANNLVITKID